MTYTLLSHPVTQKTRRLLRRVVVTCAVVIAVAFVTTLTIDLGPTLKSRAEAAASQFMRRPMHIGRMSVHLWRGQFVFEDLVIEGLTPESRPFLTARRITVSMPWNTLVNRRVVFDDIEMTDWRMYVETFPDGRHNFPRVRPERRGPSAWTTTLQYVRARRGEFTFVDHGTPWSVVTRNLDVVVTRPNAEYRGQAKFWNGTVAIQHYVPMRADMSTSFRIVDGKVVLDRIDLLTDGAESQLTGEVDFGRWPDQFYRVRSRVDFPRMREIFFADDDFTLAGQGDFTGTFRLFREVVNGRSRTGRELEGTFSSTVLGVNAYTFGDLRGALVWVPERFEVTNASATVYGGTSGFEYRIAPLGQRGVPAVARFDATYENVDLAEFTNFLELDGLRLAGRASGRNLLEWPLGRFSDHRGDGAVRVEPAPDVETIARELTPARIEEAERRARRWGPFSNHLPREPVPVRGELTYAYGPEWVDIGPSYAATPDTFVAFEGRTAYGDRSRIAFHVTSADWQESDRLFAGVLTAFGARTRVIDVGGSGTFDGVLVNSVRQPRIEGAFAGEHMRAFDVVWGSATGRVTIENAYADVASVLVRDGDSEMRVDGRFSLGFPRRDGGVPTAHACAVGCGGGEEMNARIRVVQRPLADLRHAFELDEYDVDGRFSGEFHVYGPYRGPFGFGEMTITDGVAYGESFETASSAVRLEGDGVRLDSLQITKAGGRATGAAYVGLNGTYSFNLVGRGVPIEHVALTTSDATPPLTGRLDFAAGGSGTFERPRYDVRLTISDLFVGDEGVGQVLGELNVNDDMMTVKLEAASPRLAVSGSGRVALTPGLEADLSFSIADTSLDPYLRAFNPRLSPYTTAIASGNVRLLGQLANVDALLVEALVERLDLRFFDYRLRNAAPIRLALDRHTMRLEQMRLIGEDTQLDLTGLVNLHDERIAVRATGDAGLGLLQGFAPNIRSSGRASLEATFEGPMRDPIATGTMTVENGRIRLFEFPHALENISGPVRFDTRSIRLDEVTARLGGGLVRFGGRIDIESYRPTRIDVTMAGEAMRLRFPEGMRSLVDADLTVQGMIDAPTLAGTVTVRNAVYTRPFEEDGGLFDLTADATAGTAAPRTPRLPLRYDVRIVAPSTLEIRNSVARVFATADLQLRGTFDRPVLFGRAEVERGEFSFEGRRYQITRGTIDFNNPTRIQPFFDIETETRVRVPGQTYRVRALAAGTLDRLTPSFEADPPLPEVEVLSLLFGDVAPGQDVEFRQYSTNITPQQQLLRERATRALTGAFSSEVGRVVEQTFGVDTFQLTPSLVDPNAQSSRLDPAARVTIGKRLSERIYLTYSRSLSSSTRDQIILLEYDQTDRFSWILSRNEDRTYALDVRVRHAF
ncbi:MAG: translocation/assembly module TamB domain-containing protein [Acidobacteria bacterium]|nr:translocation/assembly module TamB domain-containing protein [Acidobacteriota bacterium]